MEIVLKLPRQTTRSPTGVNEIRSLNGDDINDFQDSKPVVPSAAEQVGPSTSRLLGNGLSSVSRADHLVQQAWIYGGYLALFYCE